VVAADRIRRSWAAGSGNICAKYHSREKANFQSLVVNQKGREAAGGPHVQHRLKLADNAVPGLLQNGGEGGGDHYTIDFD
jgi:hypothetical protein